MRLCVNETIYPVLLQRKRRGEMQWEILVTVRRRPAAFSAKCAATCGTGSLPGIYDASACGSAIHISLRAQQRRACVTHGLKTHVAGGMGSAPPSSRECAYCPFDQP